MGQIHNIEKLTDCKFLNLYHLNATSIHNTPVSYFVASRAKSINELKIKTGKNTPDGVIIYSLYGEKRDRVVLVRQYRYAIGGYIYEFPRWGLKVLHWQPYLQQLCSSCGVLVMYCAGSEL